MTSRTPMAAQQRQAQRSLSSSSLSAQRPVPPQRTISQHHHPASPVRRDTAHTDPLADSADATSARHGTSTPRRGGSRLRLELSNDNVVAPQLSADSPQSLASAPTRALSTVDGLDTANSPALSRASQAENDNPPMPMPPRRQLPAHRPTPSRDADPAPTSAKKDGRPKPYTVETPTKAPRLAATSRGGPMALDQFGKGVFSGYADFAPWTGKHREDEWSNESISKGVWEKHMSTESSSARLAILPALKQKSGLNALSTIFMGVLNQRRQRGQIIAPSTFKPPPRVTLTDTKREVWLKDLANPATSLRRLSRTIPHGIRGRALLDQCLNKNVPTERAVWLAKCVGANEIRAFKRKGANAPIVLGGEAKWSRDWTIYVEQFVDAVVSSINEDGWKSRVTYAIRLATSLYSEQLLDRDHYLDWVLSGLENGVQGKLPIWMLLTQIYWSDLLRSRKYGIRLVSALLSHMHTIHNDPDRDILTPLADHLSTTLTTLVKNNAESFILPTAWSKYRECLKAAIPMDDEAAQRAYNSINGRNMRFASAGNSYPLAGRQQLIRLLDSTFQNNMEADLATRCWAATDDKAQLVTTVVEWATSMHRSGISRLYVATTMLKNFSDWSSPQSFDVTGPVLSILDNVSPHDQDRKKLIFHLVAELARDGIFHVPRYLQWLISRGGIYDESEIDPEHGTCATRLLVEIPIDAFHSRLRTDRANLLRRAGNYSVVSEEEDISTALRCVRQTLGLPLPPDDALAQRKPMPLKKLLARIQNSSRALRSAVGSSLRTVVVQQGLGSSNNSTSALGLFIRIRSILEATQDFTILSDIIQSCLKSSDADILAACADTVNANIAVFAAMRLAAEYFGVLVERLKTLSQQGAPPHPLLAAVAHLAQQIPGREDIANQLRQELLQSDRSNAIDACSPVSDSMALQAQSGEGDLSEEVDKLLASGTRIDHPTMNRLFRTILPRLEAGWAKGDDSRRVFAALLAKMRVFDTQHFDKLIADWASHVRSLPTRPGLADLFPILVIMGCLTVPTLIKTANASPPMTSNPSPSAGSTNGGCTTYLQEILELLLMKLPKSTGLGEDEVYRFGTHQKAAKLDNVPAFLTLIRNAISEYSALRDQKVVIDLALDDSALRDQMLDTLKLLVVINPPAASEALGVKDLPPGATQLLSRVTTKLLLPDGAEDQDVSFDYILGLATELTLPFCQIKLEFDLSVNEANPSTAESPAPSRSDLFANAMDRAIEANNITWTSMLPCLSGDVSQHLKGLAMGRLLGLIPSLKSPNLAATTSKEQTHLGENLVGVIEAITTGQTSPRSTQLSPELVDKLCDQCEIVASRSQELNDVRATVIGHWIPALLQLITIQGAASGSDTSMTPPPSAAAGKTLGPPASHETRARIIVSLCNLLLELQLLPTRAIGDLPGRIFDVAILLVDGLPEDTRLQCARHTLLQPGTSPAGTTNLSSDPRLRYLFGAPQATLVDNLALSHKDKLSNSQAAGPRNMGAMYGIGPQTQEKLTPFAMRRWEMLSESTPNIGENDTSLSLGLFEAIKIQ